MPSGAVKRYIEPALPPGFPRKKTKAAAQKMPAHPRGALVALKTRAEIRSGLQTSASDPNIPDAPRRLFGL